MQHHEVCVTSAGLCDFQFLPLVMSEDEMQQMCVYDQLVPQGMERADWLNQPAPLYLPPAAFTRMDTPQVTAGRRGSSLFIIIFIISNLIHVHCC